MGRPRRDAPLYTLGRLRSGRCTATSRTGKRCAARAVLGSPVCHVHGALAPAARVRAYIASLVDPDHVLAETARIAYADPRHLFDDAGKLRPMTEWHDEVAPAVASVEVTKRNLTMGDGAQDDVVRIRFWDKLKALELLGTRCRRAHDSPGAPARRADPRFDAAGDEGGGSAGGVLCRPPDRDAVY